MKTNMIMSAVFVVAITASTPALAGDGFYISGGVNSTTQENNNSRDTGSNQPNMGAANGPSNTVVDKETGIGFVGGVGYKHHFTDDFFASVEGFYSTEDVETTIINSVFVNNVVLNSTYGADLRLGHNVTDKVAIYGLMSATAFDFDSNMRYTFAPPVASVSANEWAFVYGGGVELKVTDNISTFGEFRIANDLGFAVPVDQGGISSRNELNYTTLRTGLKYSF